MSSPFIWGSKCLSPLGATDTFLKNDGNGNISWASPVLPSLNVPTIQKFISTSPQTGWLFTISTTTTCAAGDTYTNNSNTYTVLYALSAQSGQVLWMTGTGATSGTTLTRASGSGTSSISFSSKVATATYTTPSPNPLYLKLRLIGGGGGGGGPSASNGSAGSSTAFANLILCNGGNGGNGGAQGTSGVVGGTGGTVVTISDPNLFIISALTGGSGCGGSWLDNTFYAISGGVGAASPFGGAGGGARSNGNNGLSAIANTGSGGGGGNTANGSNGSGDGGGAGGYAEAIISNPNASYSYVVGSGGSAGTNAGAGGSGVIIVEEYYQ